jgi:hypothetical protein
LPAQSDEVGAEVRHPAAAFVADAEREPEWIRLFSEFAALDSEHPELRAELAAELGACREAIAALLERRLGEFGVSSGLPVDQLAAVASGLASDFALNRLRFPLSRRERGALRRLPGAARRERSASARPRR